MAGNRNSGRRRLSIAEHLDAGTFRIDRHGAAPDPAEGEPVCPRAISTAGRAHWKRIVPELIAAGLAKAIDAPALQQLCELWGLAQAALKQARKYPEDGAAFCRYVREYNAIAKDFGLTFGRRRRLTQGPAKDRPSGVASRNRASGA
jgi:phage terminase small subunit